MVVIDPVSFFDGFSVGEGADDSSLLDLVVVGGFDSFELWAFALG